MTALMASVVFRYSAILARPGAVKGREPARRRPARRPPPDPAARRPPPDPAARRRIPPPAAGSRRPARRPPPAAGSRRAPCAPCGPQVPPVPSCAAPGTGRYHADVTSPWSGQRQCHIAVVPRARAGPWGRPAAGPAAPRCPHLSHDLRDTPLVVTVFALTRYYTTYFQLA